MSSSRRVILWSEMRPRMSVIGYRFHAQPRGLLSSIYVSFWHNPDLQRPLELGPIMAALPTFGAECPVIAAFQTLRRGDAKVGT